MFSPHLYHQIARDHQQEIVDRAINSHRGDVGETATNPRRTIKYRLVRAAAMLGVCGAAGIAVTASNAQSNQPPVRQHAVQFSAQQVERQIRTLEAEGYVPTSCTVSGTLMRNYSTGQSVTVKL